LPVPLAGGAFDQIMVFDYRVTLGWLGVPLTVLWLVGCINALNLLDGMDGLASLIGLSTSLMLALIASGLGHPHVAVAAVVFAGVLAGFLVFNLPPATSFLGASGSMVSGLVLGLLGIQGSMKTSTTLAITAPAIVMALPMFNVLLAVIRRKLTGQRFDAADRLHIHHRLLDRGLTPRQVLCILGFLGLLMGAAATTSTFLRMDAPAWITAGTLLVLAIRLRLFGDHEFSLVKKAVRGVLVRAALRLLRAFGGPLRADPKPKPAILLRPEPHETDRRDLLEREAA